MTASDVDSSASTQTCGPPDRRFALRVVGEAVAVLAVFAAAGAAAGYLWFRIWDSPPGVVYGGEWFPDPWPSGQRSVFTATVTFVVIAVVAGLVLGVVTSLLFHRWELVTLVAVVAGGALASYVMYRIGVDLGPPDAQALAVDAADETRLAGSLSLPGRSPFLAWPLGALIGLAVAYFATASVADVRRSDDEEPAWLGRDQPG